MQLYRALAAFISAAIEDGRLRSGDGLPGEQSIADAAGGVGRYRAGPGSQSSVTMY